jgi:hypothetical protein
MANRRARLSLCGSLAAGMLIGLSMVIAGFALTDTTTVVWQAALVVGAPIILVLGLALQNLVAPYPRTHV